MTDAAALEQGYRRWLRCYPKEFRREYEAEILGVLMAGAREGQRRPGRMECLDLMTSGLRIRLRPTVPRSERAVFAAIKLMYLGAALELAAAITILITISDVRSNVFSRNPGYSEIQWHAVLAIQIAPNVIGAVLAVGFWLSMAWSIGRGHRRVLVAFAIFFALNLYGLLNGLATGSAVYARPDLAIGIVVCLVELVALAVIFRVKIAAPQSGTGRITSVPRGAGHGTE